MTTATDVYGLGVLFNLLLSGQHPAGSGVHSPAALFKAIIETEAPRLSAVANSTAADIRTAAAANRGTTPAKLARLLRGDLDTIAEKALKKNPEERCSSVTAFADDLARYLKQEPISARPDTFAYRTVKFVRRNRTAVALAALVVIATLAGLAGTLLQTRIARQQRDVAYRERDRANRITGFMTNMFKVSDPSQARGKSITAREILDKAAQQIETALAKDPESQAHMMYVMGEVYDNLGLIPEGRSLVERAAELQCIVLGTDDPQTLTSMDLMGKILVEQGLFAEAESLQRKTLVARTRVLGPEDPDTLHSMSRLARVLSWEGKNAEAEKLDREALDIERRVLGPEHPETLRLTNNPVSILWGEGHEKLYVEAENMQREAIATESRVLGPEHPDTLNGMISLGVILRRRRQFADAEKVYRDTLRIQSRVLGPEHPDTLVLRDNLATALAKQARYQEAEGLYRETRSIQQRVFGPEHPYIANSTYNLACLAAVQSHRNEALLLLDQAVGHGLTANVALTMERDEDLKLLYRDPRFIALVSRAKKNDGVTPKAN